jgi:hypothetical protein
MIEEGRHTVNVEAIETGFAASTRCEFDLPSISSSSASLLAALFQRVIDEVREPGRGQGFLAAMMRAFVSCSRVRCVAFEPVLTGGA